MFNNLLDCVVSDTFRRRLLLKGAAFLSEHARSFGFTGTGRSDCWVPSDVGSLLLFVLLPRLMLTVLRFGGLLGMLVP